MPPKDYNNNKPKNINDILREVFNREFNNAKKQYEAENKQKPFCLLKSEKLELQVCFN